MWQVVILALAVLCAATGAAIAVAPQVAIFAGGCFWCLERDMEHLSGVIDVQTGYTGGWAQNPTYRDVTTGGTGHYLAVRVVFDPDVTTYERILRTYFFLIDPTEAGGQFCEGGASQRAAIFVRDDAQAEAAEALRQRAGQVLGAEVATPILRAGRFWPAEARHQGYAEANPLRYEYYVRSCGRTERLREVWSGRPMLALE